MLYWCPGECVEVVKIPGIERVLKRPPCSRVGLVSCRNFPFSVSLELKVWSILIMSSRKLNTFPSVPMKPFGLEAVAALGAGNFEKMSWTQAWAIGLMSEGLI